MPLEARLLTGLSLALAIAYWATPVAIRVAQRFEFYDRPIGYKGHAAPTPYLGGAAVVAGFVLALLAFTGDWGRTLPLVGGVAVLWVVGTVDDRRHLSPLLRVTVEVGLAAVLWQLGLGWELGAGAAVDLAVTALWIVAVVNAFNLFDNMDGAASSMGGVAAAGLSLVGIVEGDTWLAVAGATLAGACLGFLPHNLFSSPARIFLGDGGSMPIGFAVAALTMMGLTGAAPAWQSLGMGLLFVGIPALDTALVVVSRRRRGISLLTGGRDHLTHRTHRRLRTARAVAATLGAAQALVSALAVVALQGGPVAIVVAVAVYVVGLGVAITLLDTRLAPEPVEAGPAEAAPARPPRRSRVELLAPALLVPLGLAAAFSPFASAYYAPRAWVPLGLGLVALTAALAIGRPAPLTRPALLALGSLAGLAAWTLASGAWADSAQQAMVEANRTLVYAVGLGALLLLVRGERAALWLIGALAAGGLGVAAVVVARMLGSDGSDLFLNGRLDQPLGYINGQGSFFLLAFWASLAAAEQRGRPLLAGAGAGGATLLAALLLLSQSRGVALAAVASALVVLALVPGRVARAWCLLLIAGAVAAAAPLLLDVFRSASGAAPPDGVVRSAAAAALVAALAAGVAWAIVARAGAGAARNSWRRTVPAVALAAVLGVGLVAAVASGGRIAGEIERQYDAFVALDTTPDPVAAETGSRLVSGGGNRYDYWRVAWDAFKERPVLGWGAGNYDDPYFERRSTTEDIRQPHSIQLQTLSELGLVGAALLALLLAAAGWGAWRAAGRAGSGSAGIAVAGAGMVTAWAVHTSVDWIHLLPGVTLMALAGLAVLLAPAGDAAPRDPQAPGGWRPRPLAAVAVGIVLAVAGLSLTRQGMTEHFRSEADDVLAANPAQALVEADRALRLDPELIGAYYVKAAAFARFNEAQAARGALEEAARREPRDFVTWALLGDLSVRLGELDRARREYGRASALNPRDPSLAASAREPDRGLNATAP